MAYRDGGGYMPGSGYPSDPPHLGNTVIDPDEFPHVAQLLQQQGSLGGVSHSSSSGSTGVPYPEEMAARHLHVTPNGAYYFSPTAENAPASASASYSGYNYVPAPYIDAGSNASAPHMFAGALRSPTDNGYHGMGYFDPFDSDASSSYSYPSIPTYMNTPFSMQDPYNNYYSSPPTSATPLSSIPQNAIPALPPAPLAPSSQQTPIPGAPYLSQRSFSYEDSRERMQRKFKYPLGFEGTRSDFFSDWWNKNNLFGPQRARKF